MTSAVAVAANVLSALAVIVVLVLGARLVVAARRVRQLPPSPERATAARQLDRRMYASVLAVAALFAATAAVELRTDGGRAALARLAVALALGLVYGVLLLAPQALRRRPARRALPAGTLGDPELIDALDRDDRIAAIRRFRELSGAGLAEATAAVDELAVRHAPAAGGAEPRG